jgi:hypothetical protein
MKYHYHAGIATEIIDYTWKIAKPDMYNVSVGQMLTVSAAIIMHTRLTVSSPEEIEPCKGKLEIIEAAFSRNKEHCRILTVWSVLAIFSR